MDRIRRLRTIAIAVGVVVVAVIVGLVVNRATSSSQAAEPPTATATATEGSPASAEPTSAEAPTTPDASASPTPEPTPVLATPDSVQAAPAPDGDDFAVLDPVPLESAAPYGNGVVASLWPIERTQAHAAGPGEVAGEALLVTIDLVNGTPEALNLDAVVVDLYGPDGAPAQQYLADSRVAPFTGALAPGATATGVYLIKAPSADGDITLTVSYDAALPAVSFTGKA